MKMNRSRKVLHGAGVLAATVLVIAVLPRFAESQMGTLFVENDMVGIGVAAPSNLLHVLNGSLRIERNDGATPNIRFRTTGALTQNWLFQNNSASGVFAIRDETAGNSPFRMFPGGAESTLVLRNGNVGIGKSNPAGTLDVQGSIFQSGVELHADYVFEPGYELPSIEAHSASMWERKHLPGVPPKKVDDAGFEVIEIGSHRRGMLEEIETAHIYIEQLNEALKSNVQTIDVLTDRLARLEEQVAALQASEK